MGKLLKLSVSAAIVAATCSALAGAGASAQTFEQNPASCQSAAYGAPYGYPSFGPQELCQVSSLDQALSAPETLIVEADSAAIDPTSCQGVVGPGYTTAPINDDVPYSYSTQFSNSPACAFEVTTGTVPPGAPVGSFTLISSYAPASLDSLVCGDPSCDSTPAISYYPPQQPSVIYVPTYSAPAVSYSQPADNDNDNDGDDQSWQQNQQWQNWQQNQQSNNGSGQDQNHHWNGDSGQWQGSNSNTSSTTQSNSGQSGDQSDHHHDDQSNSSQTSGNQHHDHDSATPSTSGASNTGSGTSGGDSGHHHHDGN